MPPRSLRVGTRLPNPGAVFKGCPRPEVLRFFSLFGGKKQPEAEPATVYGNGTYSNNIWQDGVLLQPQPYELENLGILQDCIVITGAATVAPDAVTGSAVFSCRNLLILGANASLTASVNCKGLLGFVRNITALRYGCTLHMNYKGKAGNFGNVTAQTMLPAYLASTVLASKLNTPVVSGTGAGGGGGAGGAYNGGPAVNGNPGGTAGAFQTGGGGSGSTYGGGSHTGNGGNGGPFCGGAGSGASINNGAPDNAGSYGGPGSTGKSKGGLSAGGGAGDPPGPGSYGGTSGWGPGGGLLMLFSAALTIGAGCIVSANGSLGGNGATSGGSAGGGCICFVTVPNQYANFGTVSAAGGAADVQGGAAGGAGSVNILTKEAT